MSGPDVGKSPFDQDETWPTKEPSEEATYRYACEVLGQSCAEDEESG
jgi:hypothetical protein